MYTVYLNVYVHIYICMYVCIYIYLCIYNGTIITKTAGKLIAAGEWNFQVFLELSLGKSLKQKLSFLGKRQTSRLKLLEIIPRINSFNANVFGDLFLKVNE